LLKFIFVPGHTLSNRHRKSLPTIIIVSPYLASANNGNWRTARRWADQLQDNYDVIVQSDWNGEPCDLLIALHARRSHAAIKRFRNSSNLPLVLVLTGTDLYRDLPSSAEARNSLELASVLVVLQEDAVQYVPLEHRRKTHVIYQSAHLLRPAAKARSKLDCVAVGHLRHEKDPLTLLRALDCIPARKSIHILHIGAPLDDELAGAARAKAVRDDRYHWADALPHGLARAAIKRAHVLIHPSIMEGGANVIVEALTSGTPVIGSEISGNIGMLGKDYPGYFPVGDAAALAGLLEKCLEDPNFYSRLNNAAKARAPLFAPAAEKKSINKLVSELLQGQ
jgi:putative glycosyltransferase (TIGR04348 family)